MALGRFAPGRFALGTLVRACACVAVVAVIAVATAGAQAPRTDSSRGLIPPGFGSLRRDDASIVVQVQGLTVKATPLDESVIRALAPDSYLTLHAIAESKAAQIERIRSRLGLAAVQAWHVQLINLQPGEGRYDPRGMQIRSAGRDFRPLDIIPMGTGYEDGRLRQGQNVSAIFVFDPAVVLTQPLVVTLAGMQSSAWDDALQRLERERAAIWSRAAGARKPTNDEGKTPW